ncbi:uncharacterized protein N7498_003745 [Penicillium cinerascens]|uniref:LysM domain-containing protein n=1 Tax=Penicillium cinerascens TaxID=70096 RepID=A0A9W9N2N8_9EURO|nr:uncharacterized protein N7498_003745 [Penicillium cinerascens]KAJ5212099.1 hypothetical protein N7498_003745 [Penicillium cinerascens]
MKLSIFFIAALLGEAACAYKLGDKATGETDPDVIENCSRWANDIASGDTCKKLESDFDIDYLQLHEWNPSLVMDPCNPIEGWSYCVGSPSKTNSLAGLVGTEAPTLKNPNYTGSSSSASASASATAVSSANSSTNTSSTATANSTSNAASNISESPSAQKTGNAISFGVANVPAVMVSVALSVLTLQLN